MGWLGLRKRPKEPEDQVEEEAPLPPLPPVLNLLVPDVAGVTSFRLRQCFSTEEAAEYVRGLPTVSGLYAFWGLHQRPDRYAEAEPNGEAMVLIRSAEGSDTVYVVSFVDLESALSFARFEVKRGMNPALVLLYWAEIVEVQVTEDAVRFIPDSPPRPGHQPLYSRPEPAAEDQAEPLPDEEPAPQLFEAVEPESTTPATAIEETVAPPEPEWERETEEEFEQFVAELQTEAPPEEPAPAAAEPEPVALEEPEPVAVEEPESVAVEEPGPVAVEEPEPVAAEEPETVAAEEPEPVAAEEPEPVAVEEPEPVAAEEPGQVGSGDELDIEREALAFLKQSRALEDDAKGAGPEPMVEEAEPGPAQTEAPDAPAPEAEPEPVAVEAATGHDSVTTSGPTQEDAPPDSEKLVKEVEKILRVKRWDKRDSPFRGFDSPPGRF